jgi:hypothetical protein
VCHFETDESVARKESRIAPPLHRTLQQAGIDDAMHLPQWHAGDRGRLIRGHEHKHFKSFQISGNNIYNLNGDSSPFIAGP